MFEKGASTMTVFHIEKRELVESTTAVVRSTLTITEISEFLNQALSEVSRVLSAQGISPTGPPFTRYHPLEEGKFSVEAGFTTSGTFTAIGQVVPSTLPGGSAAVMTYLGPYDEMEAAYRELEEWISRQGGTPTGDPWEVYFSDPAQEPDPQKWRTEIVMPFRV